MILLSQTDWQALAAATTYSTSQVDNAIIDCLFDDHKQRIFPIIKQLPLVLFLSYESPHLIRSVIGSRWRQHQGTTWTTRRVTRGLSGREVGGRSPREVIGGQWPSYHRQIRRQRGRGTDHPEWWSVVSSQVTTSRPVPGLAPGGRARVANKHWSVIGCIVIGSRVTRS